MLKNRHSDAASKPCVEPGTLPPLPVIDWASIGQSKPEIVDLGNPDKDDPLPAADLVVMTWTSAEWAAFDHVFVNSDKEGYASSTAFQKDWHWRANAVEVEGAYHLWGYYRMVRVSDAGGIAQNVLLFKADAHLAHPPYGAGLMEMVAQICSETGCRRIMSIGTAGGATVDEKLGDTVVTNAGTIKVKLKENKALKIDGETVTCATWFPSLALFETVEASLLFKLSNVVDADWLNYLLCEAINDPEHGDPSWQGKYTVADLTNDALVNLGNPRGLDKKETPLLTTDFYYIAHGGDAKNYSTLEMDDAVVGLAAQKAGVEFAFVRNISDPLVPDKTRAGDPIPTELRENWSSQIYSRYGLYTSMNGALLTWSTIVAGQG